MARLQTVWDSTGRAVTVRSVDAAEIIAGGGTSIDPNAVVYTEAEAIAQNDGVDVTEAKEEAPKKIAKKK